MPPVALAVGVGRTSVPQGSGDRHKGFDALYRDHLRARFGSGNCGRKVGGGRSVKVRGGLWRGRYRWLGAVAFMTDLAF